MPVLAWPIGLRGPAEFDFWVDVTEGGGGDENPTSSGLVEVVSRYGRVRAEITWSYTTPAQAAAIEAHLAQMRGRRNPTQVPNLKYVNQLGSASGGWIVALTAALGSESITLSSGSGAFAPGDWIEIEQFAGVPRAHMVLGHVGNVAEIAPPLHEAVSQGKPVKHLGDGVTTIIRDTMELLSDAGPAFRLSAGPPGAIDKRSIQLVSSRRAVFVAPASGPSALLVSASFFLPYVAAGAATVQFAVPYQAEAYVSASWTLPYTALADQASAVSAQFALPYSALAAVSVQFELPYVASGPSTAIVSMQFTQAPTDSRYFNPSVITDFAAAGLNIFGIRHNILMQWSGGNPAPSPWDWSGYDLQWDAMQAAGLKLYACLFEGGSGVNFVYPVGSTQCNAWAAQALNAAQYLRANYPGMLVALEIENEPDGTWPIPAADYPPIAAALKAAIRSDPMLDNIVIAGPTTVAGEGQYIQDCIDGGLLNSIDWWSQHMYTAAAGFEARIANVRDKLTAGGHGSMPIMISEYGLHHASVAYLTAAELTCLKAAAINATAYYTSKDYGGAAGTDYGLLLEDGSLAPQGRVYRTWHNNIGAAAAFIERDSLASNVRSYHFLVS